MLMMVFLITLQWSLAAAVLCAACRRGDGPHAALATRAVAVLPLLNLVSITALLLADDILIWPERLMMLVLAALTGCLWSFGLVWGEESPGRQVRLLHSSSGIAVQWLSLSVLLQGALTLTSTWIALYDFLMRSPYMTGVWRWLWLTLLGALGVGALLVAVALAGVLAGGESDGDAWAGAPPRLRDSIPRLSLLMIALVLLRALVLAGSVALWGRACPFGARYLVERILADGYNLISLRVLLGLILPVLFGLLALLAWRGGARRQEATIQFFPALILVLISEMTAFALTVGLGGVVF